MKRDFVKRQTPTRVKLLLKKLTYANNNGFKIKKKKCSNHFEIMFFT